MNIVNKAWAEAALKRAPGNRDYLVSVFAHTYGAEAPAIVDKAIELMARNIEVPRLTPEQAQALDRQGIVYPPEWVTS